MLAITQIHRLDIRVEVGKNQSAVLVDHCQLREEIAKDSQLLVHITGEVGVLQHVFAHIQEHGIHQPYHAVHMRLEGGGQVHRVVARGVRGEDAFVLYLIDNEDPHWHQRQGQYMCRQ